VWACVGVCGRVWACVGVCGRVWACVGVCGREILTYALQKQFNLKAHTASTFLNAVFMHFTKVLSVDAEIPQEMFDLWIRLAQKYSLIYLSLFIYIIRLFLLDPFLLLHYLYLFSNLSVVLTITRPANLTIIVNFLLRKGITDRDLMPICKTVQSLHITSH
jgi:hypothetical protein